MAPGNDYSIEIVNDTNEDQSYLLFQTFPTESGLPDPKVFTNVYQASPIVPKGHHATATFKIHKQFYAVCGTAPSPLSPDVSVSTSEFETVTLGAPGTPGTSLWMTTINGDGEDPEFNDAKVTSITTNAAYAIFADHTFKDPNTNNITIGLGALDPTDSSQVIPVASIKAEPGVTSTIYPKNKYFVSTGTFTPGTIIDVTQVGTPLTVDFETGLPNQKFTNDANGNYIPKA